jgi:hypothetical protein
MFGWMFIVFKGAMAVFFSLQVIDNAQVMVKSPPLCAAFEQPVQDGYCRLTGSAEGSWDGAWFVSLEGAERVIIKREDLFGLRYSPSDYRMRGGEAGVWSLILLALFLSGGWPAYELWRAFHARRSDPIDAQ